MNIVTLLGRMVKEPELRYTQSGTAVTTFTVAVDRRFQAQGEERKADFINCVAWKKTAEFIANYFTKGQMIALCGSLQVRNWEDNEGVKRYATEVIVNEVSFAGDKKETATTAKKEAVNDSRIDDFTPIAVEDEDLPF